MSQWSKAEYWQSRTAGVIAHALHRSSASVRRGRILTLEAEQRKQSKSNEEYAAKFAAWSKVAGMEGADETVKDQDDLRTSSKAVRFAYTLASCGHCWGQYKHPRKERPATSLYTLLTLAEDPITANEAAALWLEGRGDPANNTTSGSYRWAKHYEYRLAYEKAMLENEGGMAGEVEMIPGGFILIQMRRTHETREYQIHKINRSPATKRVTSVEVWSDTRTAYKNGQTIVSPGLTQVSLKRSGEDVYRAPTAEELEAFNASKKEAKDSRTPTPTINPTDEEAAILQAEWNAKAGEKTSGKSETYAKVQPLATTQKTFSHGLKYEYYQIIEQTRGDVTVKVRTKRSGGYFDYSAPLQVIILTDKPRKAFPAGFLTTATRTAPPAFAMHAAEEPEPELVGGSLFE